MIRFQVVFLLLLFTIAGHAGGQLRSHLRKINIADLRPTQAVAGIREVRRKKNKIENFKSHKDREEYFEKNSVPVVLGPNGQIYMIDHHHFTLAASQAGYDEVYFHIVADFSTFSVQEFWHEMKAKAWVYLKINGQRITEYMLPRFITGLQDDPYRSLAGKVRQKEGYNKTEIPFVEFEWADFFRTRIFPKLLEKNYDEAVKVAIKIAKTDAAKKLPGYNGNALCIEVYAK